MLVALQLVGVAVLPLNFTVLAPFAAPKLAPAMVTAVPTAAETGFKLLIRGDCSTVKATPALATPPAVTTTFPLVAAAGTGTTILIALQLVGVAAVPLNVTVPAPCVVPKLVPAMVIAVPTGAEVGLKLEIKGVGGGVTVIPKPWLAVK
jgi:hypothetical protein